MLFGKNLEFARPSLELNPLRNEINKRLANSKIWSFFILNPKFYILQQFGGKFEAMLGFELKCFVIVPITVASNFDSTIILISAKF